MAITVQMQFESAVTEMYQDAFVGSSIENGTTVIQLTGCKFSVAQMLRSLAQREGDRIRRERCAKKNAWDAERV
jgi:hypothetical protein